MKYPKCVMCGQPVTPETGMVEMGVGFAHMECIFHRDQLLKNIKAKIKYHVVRGVRAGMSPKMVAIIGYVVGETYTHPSITEMVITSDGIVLACNEGEVGCNNLIGNKDDLDRNWRNFIAIVDLDDEEWNLVDDWYRNKIKRW